MSWKKLSKTKDFLSFEKKTKNVRIRIEARLENKAWKVYKIYYDNKNLRTVEEFLANNSKRLKILLEKLMNEKVFTKSRLNQISTQQNGKVSISLRRAFKEYEFEKWFFGVDGSDEENVVFLHFAEKVSMDIILNENFRHVNQQIIKNVEKSLGLEGIDKNVSVYFFNHNFAQKEKYKKPEFLLGKIELDMGFNDDKS